MTPKAQAVKEKNLDKLDFSENFCVAKVPIKKSEKTMHSMGENICKRYYDKV